MIQWEDGRGRLPVKSWCREIEASALQQARNLANHPAVVGHVVLLPDVHVGYGMPIGGVIACRNAVIPNAVGVDIGCGMAAVRTNLSSEALADRALLRAILAEVKARIPVGEGNARRTPLEWDGFARWLRALAGEEKPLWYTQRGCELDACDLGTLGGGNHFIELQKAEDGTVWLMLHSGSRNLGYRVANCYHREALKLDARMGTALPDKELAYLPLDHELGQAYIRDMSHALAYAAENRRVMMALAKEALAERVRGTEYLEEVNIHHNYAARERQMGEELWIHRKGATSARKGETGIIPGSMGTASYIVEGLGNPESFLSCSHGAGRRMGRAAACRSLRPEDCDEAMGQVVFDRWKNSNVRGPNGKKLPDLSESPLAYKDIDVVIRAELDLIRPVVKLLPLAVIKG